MMHPSPRLSKLSQGFCRMQNALVSRLLPADTALDNGQMPWPRVRLAHPATDCAECFAKGAAFTLYVNLNGWWRVEFSNLDVLALRPELADWLQADAGNAFSQLPQGLVRAVLERLFLPVLDDISRFTGMPALFVGSPKASASRSLFTEHLDLILRVDALRLSTVLRIAWQDAATLIPVVERLEAEPLSPLAHVVASLLAGADTAPRLLLGAMRLAPKEVASLRTGDVLLPQVLAPEKPALCLTPHLRLICNLNGSTLTVCALESPICVPSGEKPMSETAAKTAAGGTLDPLLGQDNLEALELDITFELPGLRLPLAECAKLVAGYTFTLPADAANLPVSVRAGGCMVALGRLVDVGGTVGVQLTQIVGTAEKGSCSTADGD